ncbi:MAG: lipid-A-disaccharide synthase [Acidobacteriota bacterium]
MPPEDPSPSIFLSAAEISGDNAGACLVAALRQACPGAHIFGCGGRRMAEAGAGLVVKTTDFGVVGLFEVFGFIPRLFRAFFEIRKAIRSEKPQVAVLIGYEGFHVPLARWLRRKGIYTVSYLPPQVWLWGALARPIARSYDEILAVVPDEAFVYEQAGARVSFVGHYLKDRIPPRPELQKRAEIRKKLGLKNRATVVALLPGSRRVEIELLTPVLLASARRLLALRPETQFVLPVAEPCYRRRIEQQVRSQGLKESLILADNGLEAMAASRLVLLASGTAALEAALLGIPMVIVYRLSRLTVAAVRLLQKLRVIRYECIGLPNLLLNRMVVPELHQGEACPERIIEAALPLLTDGQKYEAMKAELVKIREMLGDGNSSQKAAALLLCRAREAKSC